MHPRRVRRSPAAASGGEPVGAVHRFEAVDSTQDAARRLLDAGTAGAGDVILAASQSAGRGRHGRRWASPPGGLYATFIRPTDPLVFVRAGVAVADALRSAGIDARLKWPNDLLVAGEKLAGILIERAGPVDLIGVGMNWDASGIEGAIGLCRLGSAVTVEGMVEAIARHWPDAAPEAALERYRALSVTLGQPVRIELGGGRSGSGVAVGIDGDGRLIVRSGGRLETFASGDCVHLRVEPGSIDRSGGGRLRWGEKNGGTGVLEEGKAD